MDFRRNSNALREHPQGFRVIEHWGDEPVPVFAGRFPPMLLQMPYESTKDLLRHFHRLNKNPLRKNCLHPTASEFGGIFAATDEALLTQGEDNKGKSTRSGRCGAARVRHPNA